MGRLLRGALLALVAVVPAWAQDVATVEQQVEKLRAQLREVVEKEAYLQVRAHQLEEDLKPESIERSVAHIGTTNAAALRDQRRQQLERQKAGVDEQLTSLASSRSRLEASIVTAEAEGVRLRAAALAPVNTTAQTKTAAPTTITPAPPVVKKRQRAARTSRRVRRSRPRRRAPL